MGRGCTIQISERDERDGAANGHVLESYMHAHEREMDEEEQRAVASSGISNGRKTGSRSPWYPVVNHACDEQREGGAPMLPLPCAARLLARPP